MPSFVLTASKNTHGDITITAADDVIKSTHGDITITAADDVIKSIHGDIIAVDDVIKHS